MSDHLRHRLQTFVDTRQVFEAVQTNRTAGAYLRALIDVEGEDDLGDDDFLNGLTDIRIYLEK